MDINPETSTIGPGAVSVPSNAQRNPSTTPTIGFRPYKVCQGSENRLLGYATGVAKSQNCVRNGTIYRTSRNFTFIAESHSPTPSAVHNESIRRRGSHN